MQTTTERVWESFHAPLQQFIRRRVSDDAAAEDLLQEVFVRIHTHMETLEDSDRLESWIYQIARNAVIDHYRTRRQPAELTETAALAPEEEEPDAAEELAGSLRDMSKLYRNHIARRYC